MLIALGIYYFVPNPDRGKATTLAERLTLAEALDQDNDRLPDTEEAIYNTDPKNPDTDGDGYLDGDEVIAGYDPLKPAPNDKILNPLEYVRDVEPKLAIIMPDDSDIKISQRAGRDAVQQYFNEAATPDSLKDSNLFRAAISDAAKGKTLKIDSLLADLERSYSDLKDIRVPVEIVDIHKLTLALMPPTIQLFEELKLIQNDPMRALLSIKSSKNLTPYMIILRRQIDEVANKYKITPLQ